MRWVFVLSAALAAGVVSSTATAQVSDQERAAARALFQEGAELQNKGRFEEALDKFERAQRVFSAPTILLHVAECQAALKRLVEAAETYRSLVRMQLPANPPEAYVKAQQQGAAELAQLEPRIPTLRIDVAPPNVLNLQVLFDDQSMNTALVGVNRPVNPGTHRVTVYAPGYGRQDQQVEIKEGQSPKSIAFTLQPSSGVVYAPVPPATNSLGPNTAPAPAQTPPGDQGPAKYEYKAASKNGPATGMLLGARLGGSIPTGVLFANNSGALVADNGEGTEQPISKFAKPGPAFGLEGVFRFARVLGLGAAFEHDFLSGGEVTPVQNVGELNASANSSMVGATGVLTTNPEGVGFYGEIGVGYRWLNLSWAKEGTGSFKVSRAFQGPEFILSGGISIRAGSIVLIPKIGITVAALVDQGTTCESSLSGVCQGLTLPATAAAETDRKAPTFVFLGLGGHYNLDFGKN